MKVSELELGKYYECLLTHKVVLVVSIKDEKDNDVVSGLIAICTNLENGDVKISYHIVNLHDGLLAELKEQPSAK